MLESLCQFVKKKGKIKIGTIIPMQSCRYMHNHRYNFKSHTYTHYMGTIPVFHTHGGMNPSVCHPTWPLVSKRHSLCKWSRLIPPWNSCPNSYPGIEGIFALAGCCTWPFLHITQYLKIWALASTAYSSFYLMLYTFFPHYQFPVYNLIPFQNSRRCWIQPKNNILGFFFECTEIPGSPLLGTFTAFSLPVRQKPCPSIR